MSENGDIIRGRSTSSHSPDSRKSGRSYSRSRSPSPGKRSHGSRSGSRSPHHRSSKYHSPSRSRSRSHSRSRRRYKRSYSRSRSRSPYQSKRSRHSRSRSRGRSPNYRGNYHGSSRHRSRSRSPAYRGRRGKDTSPMSNRRRHNGNRDNPDASKCVGVFGLSLHTQERDVREVFSRFGPLDDCRIVYDRQSGRSRGFAFIYYRHVEDAIETGRSRGFAFVYYRHVEDAIEAKDRGPGMEIDGRRIRVDFSITERAHTPTPGIYLGKPTGGGGHRRRSPSPYYGGYGRDRRYSSRHYSRSRSRSRSYSPRYY